MKYAPHVYAKALVGVLSVPEGSAGRQTDAAIARNFLELVRKNGDEPHLIKILEEASRFARGKSGVRKVTLESARPLKPPQRAALEGFLKPGDVVEERVDPELVAGIKIVVNDEMQFDGSLKSKLSRMLGDA